MLLTRKSRAREVSKAETLMGDSAGLTISLVLDKDLQELLDPPHSALGYTLAPTWRS
jgi:hypothetical protein